VITEALISLGAGRGQDVFIQVASRASSEVDANYFQQVAQLIEKYNQSEHPVQKIMRSGRTVSFQDSEGNWVFPVPFDYCLWTEPVRERASTLFAGRASDQKLLIYTTGGLSDQAKENCRNLKIDLVDQISLQ